MAEFSLPDHMIAWIEGQVALGRAASVGSYLAQLIGEDRRQQDKLLARRAAIAEARASGISMQPTDQFLARWLSQAHSPALDQRRSAIREGRESGYSRASVDGILARALLGQVAQAA